MGVYIRPHDAVDSTFTGVEKLGEKGLFRVLESQMNDSNK